MRVRVRVVGAPVTPGNASSPAPGASPPLPAQVSFLENTFNRVEKKEEKEGKNE